VAGVLALEGPLEAGVVASGLFCIVERQEILRTGFQALPGMALPIQVVLGSPLWSVQEVGLTGGNRTRQQGEGAPRLTELANQTFDLAAGPTVRFVLVRLAADRHRLLVSLPALCADGASLGGLAAELARELAGGGTVEEEGAVQYADFADWLNEQSDGEE